MKDYFNLQIKMISRKLNSFGLNPILGFCLITVGFILGSIYLFSKIEIAEYVYILIALSFVSRLSEKNRNDFLKTIFYSKRYLKLRLIENTILALPFITFLLCKQLFLSVLLLTSVTWIMGFLNFNNTFNYTISTPFYKRPFEFALGFRNSFYFIFFAYFLTLMAVFANNFNLGVFALIFVFLISFYFYSKPENEYFVWIFNKTANKFLIAKIKAAMLHSSILISPILITMSVFFYNDIGKIIMLSLILYVFLITIIFAKYAAYPNEINFPQLIIICFTLIFPPILIAVLPFFYWQSTKRLNDILG